MNVMVGITRSKVISCFFAHAGGKNGEMGVLTFGKHSSTKFTKYIVDWIDLYIYIHYTSISLSIYLSIVLSFVLLGQKGGLHPLQGVGGCVGVGVVFF